MVSFWPFRGSDSSSAASFEKTLSQLSTKITRYSTQVESFRSKQRRFKALWTLYSAFAYILITAILVLVTGWPQWGAGEYTAVAGGPVAIVGIRYLLDAWYDYRANSVQKRLQQATKEREKVIEKLKIATKYDSTQQLLDKYGGGGAKPSKEQQQQQQRGKSPKRKLSSRQSLPAHFQQQTGPRTGFAPPPTANIPGRQPSPQNAIDARLQSMSKPAQPQPQPNESFAPNAFPSTGLPPQQTPQYAPAQPAWYDRLMDVVLGEDETQAKNRFALICAQCRLVNGQAPPGARALEDVGRWRCKECHAVNGVEKEEGVVKKEEESDEDAEEAGEAVGANDEGSGRETTPASSTRSKVRQRKKA
ncbi:hypothetical protein Q7P37_003233 [Cladosporium fusiforme]